MKWLWKKREESNWYILMLEAFLFMSFINDIIDHFS